MKAIVAIANHGLGNRAYLEKLIAAYRAMPIDVSIVILSNIPKDLGPGIEVVVGVPSKNPWSLPFAHRELFRQRINQYDLFIYSEDDTLIEWEAISAFLEDSHDLNADEIPGYIRSETSPSGDLFYSTCHSFFRWLPQSVRNRNGKLWAQYSNEHSACFVATRAQLKDAIERGGFPSEPHEGRFDMLCSAATDIYTRGGLQRVVCLDKIPSYTLPHLPNKYIGRMGLAKNEFDGQITALRQIASGDLPDYSLLFPETKLPGGFGSKFYRETEDKHLNSAIGSQRKKVLVWGAGDGFLESTFARDGHDVTVFPLDAVVGENCRARGLQVAKYEGSQFPLAAGRFDTIVLSDIIHLIDDPESFLRNLGKLLTDKGTLILRLPNFHSLPLKRRRRMDERFRIDWTASAIGATPFTRSSLKALLRSTGFQKIRDITPAPNRLGKFGNFLPSFLKSLLSSKLYFQATLKS